MIFTAIVSGFCFFFQSIFDIFTVPPMPDVIINALSFINCSLDRVCRFISYLYTPVFFHALIFIGLGLLTFDYVFGFVMWVIRKIPMLGIK